MPADGTVIRQNCSKLMNLNDELARKIKYLEQIDSFLQAKIHGLEGSWSGSAQVTFAEEWLRARRSLDEARQQLCSLRNTVNSLANQEMEKLRAV